MTRHGITIVPGGFERAVENRSAASARRTLFTVGFS
jgi:hypothetical protein